MTTHKKSGYEIYVFLVVWIMVLLSNAVGLWRPLELIEFDWLSILTTPNKPSNSVVIVGIDEESMSEFGLMWPWPRTLHAELIERLQSAGAAVIAFDVEFIEHSKLDSDNRFAEAIREIPKIVLAGHLDYVQRKHIQRRITIDPLDQFINANAIIGYTNLPVDLDGFIRAVPDHPKSFWSQIVTIFGSKVKKDTKNNKEPKKLIRYIKPDSFNYVHYYQVINKGNALPPNTFKGKIVLIGHMLNTSLAIRSFQPDSFPTPYFRLNGTYSPGITIHANLIDNSLNNCFVKESSNFQKNILIVITILITFAAFGRWTPGRSTAWVFLLTMALPILAITCFLSEAWIPISAPVSGVWLSYISQEGIAYLRQRTYARFIRTTFTRYVSSDVVNAMLENPEKLILGGERREVTFIFTDLSDFTTLSETLDPVSLVEIIREYFEGMGNIILDYHGTIERFAGDGLVAFFNAPLDQPDHAARAVGCAMELDSFALLFSDKKKRDGITLGTTRIGVNTGEVSVGNFGSSYRFHYTAMGDPINVAARLESANKSFGTRICISGETAGRCANFQFYPIGKVILKGKHEPIDVFTLNYFKQDSISKSQGYLSAYRLLTDNDPAALPLFQELSIKYPDDPLIRFHMTRLCAGDSGELIRLAAK